MPANHSNGNSSLEMAQSSQDLIITKGKRKKRAWIIGSVLTLIIIAIVVTVVVLVTTDNDDIILSKNGLSLEDVLEGRLSPKIFNASWISDNQLLYRDSAGALLLYTAHNQTKSELLPSSSTILSASFSYELSPDKDYILFAHDYQKLYRHTYLAKYTIFSLRTQQEVPLGVTVSGQFQDLLQYATWSPVGNALAFVFQNNIYYKPSVNANGIVTLTTDGKEAHVYNGVPDWVYEEEIFSSNNVMYFSGDGKKLAYAKFDDTNAPLMTIPYYGTPGSLQAQYTKAVQIRYPKPGTTNPQVSLHVADVTTAATRNLQVPSSLNQPLLTAITWATDEILSAIWMNRVQNEAYIVGYEPSETTFHTYKHLRQENGWVEQFTAPVFSPDGSEFVIILSQDQGGNAGSYRHLVKLVKKDDSDVEPMTSGKFVVTDILFWDQDKDMIYYEANTEEDPASLHVYSISTKTKETKCLSCDLKNMKGEACDYNSAKFSQDSAAFYIMNCAGPGVPEITIYSNDHQKIDTWEDNQHLLEISEEKSLPIIRRFTFDVADGFQAQVMLKVPPGADLSGDTKYPMVVNVYGGPDSYQVVNKFSVDWGSYLATNKSIIYATIDGRGSGLKGDKLLFAGYRNLGTVEVEDQINVTRLIQQNVPYVDSSRTAIWGWSYGGYASGLALAKDTQNVFKCAMSVAPVTDWTLYDSIYTERYMGLPVPTDNIIGYENAKLLNKFEGLRNKQYFLIHGTFDDNVHYQQSMLWSKVLEHQDILFRQQSYPDEDHSLSSVRPHLYHSLEHFLDECFDVE